MKTNVKVVFKDNDECIFFEADTFRFEEDGFCYLELFDEEDDYVVMACVARSEIKYLQFVEVE